MEYFKSMLNIISKCIEVYEESRTSVKQSFFNCNQILGHVADQNHATIYWIFPFWSELKFVKLVKDKRDQ